MRPEQRQAVLDQIALYQNGSPKDREKAMRWLFTHVWTPISKQVERAGYGGMNFAGDIEDILHTFPKLVEKYNLKFRNPYAYFRKTIHRKMLDHNRSKAGRGGYMYQANGKVMHYVESLDGLMDLAAEDPKLTFEPAIEEDTTQEEIESIMEEVDSILWEQYRGQSSLWVDIVRDVIEQMVVEGTSLYAAVRISSRQIPGIVDNPTLLLVEQLTRQVVSKLYPDLDLSVKDDEPEDRWPFWS